jgi:hypothetical protein
MLMPVAGGQLVLPLMFQSEQQFAAVSAPPEVIVAALLGASRCPAQLADHLYQVTIHGQIVKSKTQHLFPNL